MGIINPLHRSHGLDYFYGRESGADLREADLTGARLDETLFIDTDLSTTKASNFVSTFARALSTTRPSSSGGRHSIRRSGRPTPRRNTSGSFPDLASVIQFYK